MISQGIDPENIEVALLCGGSSTERTVSLASGEGAKKALQEAGFQVTVLDPAKKEDLVRLLQGSFDVAFLALHGSLGEDGTIQGFLEVSGIPYTGSGVWASALAMDKVKAKLFYEKEGLATPSSVPIFAYRTVDYSALIKQLGPHCVVKPSAQGSALGVFIVEGEEELKHACTKVFALCEEALVETYVAGRECTVAVVGGREPKALPVIEIIPQKNAFYDYASKYLPGGSVHVCPAELNDAQSEQLKDMAVRAHKVIGCWGMSRSDFILDANGKAWLLETNTIPGMTETSLLPDAARAAGVSFSELCGMLVSWALERNGYC